MQHQHWRELLSIDPQQSIDEQFNRIADFFLKSALFMIASEQHRLLEIELYLHTTYHPDPFTHCSEFQRSFARWYFHRKNKSFCGGSFKGLDITFAPHAGFAGILIRTIENSRGEVINGSSLVVDYLLHRTGHDHIQSLNTEIDNREIYKSGSPVYFTSAADANREILSTSRVGLSLKQYPDKPMMPDYIARPYRFLSEPKIKKGKEHTVYALYRKNLSIEQITQIIGIRHNSVVQYIDAFEKGALMRPEQFAGKSLSILETCQMIACCDVLNK